MSRLVSIVIPVHNRAELLRETLALVQAQTYPKWECLVVDDASTDGTADAVEAIVRTDPRIQLVRRAGSKGGAQVCRYQGLLAACGEFVVFLDSDDLLAPFCLEQRVQIMVEHPELGFAAFPCIQFREKPDDLRLLRSRFITAENDLDRFLKNDVVWITSGPIWRRKTLEELGPWDESLPAAQDWEFHLRALMRGVPYRKVDEPDWFWRVAADRQTIGNGWFDPVIAASRRALFTRMVVQLQASGQLTPMRQRICWAAGLKESFIYCRHHRVREGLQLWDEFKSQSPLLPSSVPNGLVRLFLRLQAVRYVRKLAGLVLERYLPAECRFAIGARPTVKAAGDCRALRGLYA